MDKQKFIDQYNLEHAVEQNSLKTFTSHFTLRNVLAGILLSIGIIVFVIYILVFSAYNEYGSVYTSMQDVFNSHQNEITFILKWDNIIMLIGLGYIKKCLIIWSLLVCLLSH